MLRLLSATPKLESDLTLTLAGTGDTGDTGAGMLRDLEARQRTWRGDGRSPFTTRFWSRRITSPRNGASTQLTRHTMPTAAV
jgi:hypothetical protein